MSGDHDNVKIQELERRGRAAMTLLGRETGSRLDYRGFPGRAAPADRSAEFGDYEVAVVTVPSATYDNRHAVAAPTLAITDLPAGTQLAPCLATRAIEFPKGTS